MARRLADVDLTSPDVAPIRDLLAPEVTTVRVQLVEVYRVTPAVGALPGVETVVDVAAPALPPGYNGAAADRLAAQALSGSPETRSIETLLSGGDLLHAAAVIRGPDRRAKGVVVATDYLTGEMADRARRMTQAFESYNQLRVLRRPLTGLYLSFFLMVTLLILFGAIWMGSYLAKRITRPVLLLAAAAREIGAGHLDQRIEPQSNDEFGALTEAFNAMAGELAAAAGEGRTLDPRARAQEHRGRGPPPLHRDDSRTDHDGRRVDRRLGHRDDDQRRRRAPPGPRSVGRRPAGRGGVRPPASPVDRGR